MQPPNCFYYNLGEWFRDMREQVPPPDEGIDLFDAGRQVGLFYRGLLDATNDAFVAIKLTGEFIHTQFTSDDDNLSIEFSDDEGDSDK